MTDPKAPCAPARLVVYAEIHDADEARYVANDCTRPNSHIHRGELLAAEAYWREEAGRLREQLAERAWNK